MKRWLPPALLDVWRALRAPRYPPEWEYCPDGFRTRSASIKGWNVEAVVRSQVQSWPAFVELVNSRGPLGINHTDLVPTPYNHGMHNTVLTFGYVLARTALGRDTVRFLDWGGGIGHYAVLSRALMPEVRIDYFCKEVPLLCQAGRELLPDATFLDRDEDVARQQFDLVMASGSMHYAEDWRAALALLARATVGYLYITRLPVVEEGDSFVVVQRPYACGYDTEYLGWFLKREELLAEAERIGLDLVRELLVDERPVVVNAPAQAEYRGFLFRPRGGAGRP